MPLIDPLVEEDELDIFLKEEEALERLNEFESFLTEEKDADEALSSSLDQALPQNPDQVAKTSSLSERSGVPEEAVIANPEAVEQQIKKQEIEQIFVTQEQQDSAVKSFLSDPSNARLFHDDVPGLMAAEKATKDITFSDSFGSAVDGVQAGFFGAAEAYLGYFGADELATLARIGREENEREAAPVSNTQKLFDVESPDEALLFVKQGIGQVLPSIATVMAGGQAIALGATAVGAAAIAPPAAIAAAGTLFIAYLLGVGGIQGQIKNEDPNSEGKEDLAIVGGLPIALLDSIVPGKQGAKLLASIGEEGITRTAKEIFKRAATEGVKQGAIEEGTEQAQNVVEDIVTNIATGKEFDIDKSVEKAKDTAGLGFLGGKSMASTVSVISDVSTARRAVKHEKALINLSEKILDLKSAKRDVKKAVQLQAELLKAQDVDGIFVPVDELVEFAGNQEGDFIEEAGLTESLEQAKLNAGEVKVTPEQYAEFFSMSPDFKSISQHIRLGEEEMTSAEAKDLEEELPSRIEKIVEEQKTSEEKKASKEKGKEDEKPKTEVESDIEFAEEQTGLKAMFETGEEIGFTETQTKQYLEAVQRTADGKVKRETLRREKRNLKKAKEQLKQATIEMRQVVEEEIKSRPEYQALDIIRDGGKLDLQSITDSNFLGEAFDKKTLERFPRLGKKQIFGSKKLGQDTFSADVLADLVGLPDGDALLRLLIDLPSLKDATIQEADARIASEKGELSGRVNTIQETIEGLYVDEVAQVLELELNALRGVDKNGKPTKVQKVKASTIRKAAKKEIQKYKLRDMAPIRFTQAAKRYGKLAGKLLRAGKRQESAVAKYKQIVNFQLSQEAFAARDKVKLDKKYLKKVSKAQKLGGKKPVDKKLPPDYSDAIRGILNSYNSGGAPLPEGFDLVAWQQQEKEDGIVFDIPELGNSVLKVSDLTFGEFTKLVQDIKSIEHHGRAKNEVIRQMKGEMVSETVNKIVIKLQDTLSPNIGRVIPDGRIIKDLDQKAKFVPIVDDVLERAKEQFKKNGSRFLNIVLNADTILRQLDGWESLGTFHQAVKGRLDIAMSEGYLPGQVGYITREELMLEEVLKRFDVYDVKEQANMNRGIIIPGLGRVVTHKEVIATILNSGNAENIAALYGVKGKGVSFTEQEHQAILNYASKKDFDFAQSIWDLNDSYWNEIVESTVRRKNFKPEKVIAQPLETKYGTYAGGFYHISYEGESLVTQGSESMEDMMRTLLTGGFASAHTQDSHIQKRKGSGGRKLNLDPFLIVGHLDRVIYDLEVGEAIEDAFKVLHNPKLKQAFEDLGRTNVWETLDIWFRDVVSGEMSSRNVVENFLRRIRVGKQMSILAFNVGVGALQPLGILQSAAVIGKKRVAESLALHAFALSKGDFSLIERSGESTGFMRHREHNFNRARSEAKNIFKRSFLNVGVAGQIKAFYDYSSFLLISKGQRLTDLVTWQAGYSEGMEKFGNDEVLAKRHADGRVETTQGSGIFHQRSAFERGSLTQKIRQTEWIKSGSLFSNYFVTKTNRFYEIHKKSKAKIKPINSAKDVANTIMAAADYSTNIALLFIVESALALVVRNKLSDDDTEEEVRDKILEDSIATFAQGIPIVRQFMTSIRGFAAGGVLASVTKDFSDLYDQVKQGEIDEGLITSLNRNLGTYFGYPSSQTNNTGKAINKALDGQDVEFNEYLFGPKFEE